MATVTSAVDICNHALALCGQGRIGSIAPVEDSSQSRACAQVFTEVLKTALYDVPWNFATRRASLGAPLSETPAYEWTYAFLLPTDPLCLRVLSTNQPSLPWVVEGRKLLIDSSTVSIKYTALITDESQWDPGFAHALALLLAAKIAYTLTKNPKLAEALEQRYFLYRDQHATSNAQEGAPPRRRESTLELVR